MRKNSRHRPESIEKMRISHIGLKLGEKDSATTRRRKALATHRHWNTPSIRKRMTEAIRASWAKRKAGAVA